MLQRVFTRQGKEESLRRTIQHKKTNDLQDDSTMQLMEDSTAQLDEDKRTQLKITENEEDNTTTGRLYNRK